MGLFTPAITPPTPGSVKPLNTRQIAKAATRAKVLSAAKTLFGVVGYEASTIRDIADWANVSTGAVFASFSGKAELWQAIYGDPPIPPEKARVLLAAAIEHERAEALDAEYQDLVARADAEGWDEQTGGSHLSDAWAHVAEAYRHAGDLRRAAIALATTPSEGLVSSVAESGSSQPTAVKSDSGEGH